MTDLSLRQLSEHIAPGFLHLDRNQVFLNVNALLNQPPGAITVDSPLSTDVLVKLLEAFYVAQNQYNLSNTPIINSVAFRINTPRVLDKRINAQLSWECQVYAFLKTDTISVITQ